MKLLLTSTGLSNDHILATFMAMLPKQPADCAVLLVAYVQDEQEQFYIDQSKNELMEAGLVNITFFNLKDEKFDSKADYDVIYACGGNTFAILERMRITGYDKYLIARAGDEHLVYVGVSAGSIVVGPSIAIAGNGDDNEVGLTDLAGLGIVDFAVSPHYVESEYDIVQHYRQQAGYDIIILTDDQSLLVENSERNIINTI